MGNNAQTSVPLFVAGAVLTAADMNISAATGVPVFAGTATRDAGFGGSGEKTLAEGQVAFVEGTTGGLQYYDSSAWVNLGTGKWQTWTPTYAGLTLGNGTVVARYLEIGKYGYAYLRITLGSTSSLSAVTAVTISNPSTMDFAISIATNVTPIGQVEFRDEGTNSYMGVIGYASTTTVQPRSFSVSGSLVSGATSTISTFPFTWGSTDTITAYWFYHKA